MYEKRSLYFHTDPICTNAQLFDNPSCGRAFGNSGNGNGQNSMQRPYSLKVTIKHPVTETTLVQKPPSTKASFTYLKSSPMRSCF